MNTKKNSIILNGEEISVDRYFEAFANESNQTDFYNRIGISNYQEIGYLQSSVLSVCRQALETDEQIILKFLCFKTQTPWISETNLIGFKTYEVYAHL